MQNVHEKQPVQQTELSQKKHWACLQQMNLSLKTEHITEKLESLLSLLTNVGIKANRSNLIRVVTLQKQFRIRQIQTASVVIGALRIDSATDNLLENRQNFQHQDKIYHILHWQHHRKATGIYIKHIIQKDETNWPAMFNNCTHCICVKASF